MAGKRVPLNAVDRLIAYVDPARAVQRARARQVLGLVAHYDAASPGRLRRHYRDASAPDRITQVSAESLRAQIRQAERNHDLVRGSLDVLVNNAIGPNGIGVEPQPRRMDGSIHTEYAATLRDIIKDWQRRPEVTWTHDWESTQRLMGRTFFRDGEAFAQRIRGSVPGLTHGSRLPYSLEMLEADMVPMGYNDDGRGIRQGCQRDAWGRRLGWWVYKRHPGDINTAQSYADTKWIPGDRMLQLAQLDRIGQLRGVTRYASVMTRLEDLRDYEESERVAAKIAANLTAYVKRQAPEGEGYVAPELDENGQVKPRELSLAAGTIIDTLAIGEEIGLVDTNRPNPNLVTWRGGQLRAFAAGINASYSSLSRDYNGTYSAQRQELVEQWVHYAAMTDQFVGMCVQPVHEDIIDMAILSGLAPAPRDLKPGSQFDFLFVAPSMPWINPMHEASAWLDLVQAGFASEVEVIRKRGGNPDDTMAQIEAWRTKARAKRLGLSSDMGSGAMAQQAQQAQQAAGAARP